MADVLAVQNGYRTQSWATVIQDCNISGLSNREFCRQWGISEKSFYYRLRKLRGQMTKAAAPQLIKLGPDMLPADMLQKSDVRLTKVTVEVFFGENQSGSHPRLDGRFNQYTCDEIKRTPNSSIFMISLAVEPVQIQLRTPNKTQKRSKQRQG